MDEVIVLGSGTPMPERGRAGSAVALVAGREWVLVDCGRSATQRAIDAGLDLTGLVAVAVTHHHSDHVSDLATLATVRWTSGATTPLTVVAPSGPAATFAQRCLDAYDDQAFYRQAPSEAGPRPIIQVRVFEPSTGVSRVHAADGWDLSSALVDHHPMEPAVGYVVAHGGKRVAVSGDTALCDGMRQLAGGVDVLVHEAVGSDLPRSLIEWNASARDVGTLAVAAAPGVVVLTHMIPAPVSPEDDQRYVDEARSAGFEGPILVAHDLLRIPLSTT